MSRQVLAGPTDLLLHPIVVLWTDSEFLPRTLVWRQVLRLELLRGLVHFFVGLLKRLRTREQHPSTAVVDVDEEGLELSALDLILTDVAPVQQDDVADTPDPRQGLQARRVYRNRHSIVVGHRIRLVSLKGFRRRHRPDLLAEVETLLVAHGCVDDLDVASVFVCLGVLVRQAGVDDDSRQVVQANIAERRLCQLGVVVIHLVVFGGVLLRSLGPLLVKSLCFVRFCGVRIFWLVLTALWSSALHSNFE